MTIIKDYSAGFDSPASTPRVLKPIEFVFDVNLATSEPESICGPALSSPADFENVVRLHKACTEEGDKFDLIMAWDGDVRDKSCTCIYLGHWNDGVIEE